MIGFEDFPDPEIFEQFILDVYNTSAPEVDIIGLEPVRLIALGDWGGGEIDEQDLESEPFPDLEVMVTVSPDPTIPPEDVSLQFLDTAEDIENEMEELIEVVRLQPDVDTEPLDAMVGEISITLALEDSDEPQPREESDVLNFHLQRLHDRAYDISEQAVIIFQESDVDIDSLPVFERQAILEGTQEPPDAEVILARISPDEYRDLTEEPEPEPEEPEEPERVFDFDEEFADFMEPELTAFAISESALEVPAGKDTKQVEPRDIYPFEIAMSEPVPEEIDGIPNIDDGVGLAIGMGTLGVSEPPGNFPRTGLYIKNRLIHEGAAYVLEMYNDLVVYSAYISGKWQMKFRPGDYSSFRTFIYRLKTFGADEDEGIEGLIKPIPAREAFDRGFDILPDHPSIEGEKAAWLENRQYYEINPDRAEDPAWDNITEWMYGEPDEETDDLPTNL